MSLNDLSKAASVSSTPTEKKAIIENIEERLQRMRQFLQEKRLGQDRDITFIHFLRTQVAIIYGKDSEIIKYCRTIQGKVPADEIVDRATTVTAQAETFIYNLREAGKLSFPPPKVGKAFIGHGSSLLWRELKDFLVERLSLDWDEFNREPVAGLNTSERLSKMLSEATFAFLIMTAEDKHIDGSLHPRENVVHEAGLFQGRLGPKKAIILLEDGCEEFSNIIGLSQIRFPKGRISAAFEEIRRVLEREHVIETDKPIK